jgi:ATP-binding cassette, subfamily B (MDR/TAP), member 1
MPIFTVAAVFEMMLFTNSETKVRGILDPVMTFVNEAVNGIREVKAFALENRVTQNVRDKIKASLEKEMLKQALAQGLTQGGVQAVQLSFYAFAFWLGAKLIEDGDITFKKMNTALWALAFAASGLGTAASFFGDQGKANAAKSRIFELIDRVPPIETKPFEKMITPKKFVNQSCRGDIEFQNIKFAYPTRLGATVFKSLNFKINAGSTVAFVGSSGSGKSTVVALLERFYDPLSGTISLDGDMNIDNIDLKWLRSHISMVGQEPRLFNTTVFENIAYSNPDNVTIDQVKRAARAAHCDFIDSLEQGYDTVVGENGSKLSGGQKQRVAIARAILNQPKILLLDEATSALDNESEKIVQESLYEIMKSDSCTTIVIAHKLSTIVNADCIFVIDNEGSGSRVVESGTHKELMAKGGKYKALYDAYSSDK